MSAEDTRILRSYVVGHTKGEAALARLEARIAEYENAITWCTSCLNCSKLIDTNYAQYVELEQSKTRVETLTAALPKQDGEDAQ